VKSRVRATISLWADTDEEDNAGSGDENDKNKDSLDDQVCL